MVSALKCVRGFRCVLLTELVLLTNPNSEYLTFILSLNHSKKVKISC